MPNLSLDIPDGGGKTALVPNFEIERTAEKRVYRGWDGVLAEYQNPSVEQSLKPLDAVEYQAEWEALKNSKASAIKEESQAELF